MAFMSQIWLTRGCEEVCEARLAGFGAGRGISKRTLAFGMDRASSRTDNIEVVEDLSGTVAQVVWGF